MLRDSLFSEAFPGSWGTSKQHMKLQQPRNYDFRVSQFDPPRSQSIRKNPFSVRKIRVPAILGPEMGAPILWTPGKTRSFSRKNHVRKIPLFLGGFWGGGGSADFIFMGARIFLKSGNDREMTTSPPGHH